MERELSVTIACPRISNGMPTFQSAFDVRIKQNAAISERVKTSCPDSAAH